MHPGNNPDGATTRRTLHETHHDNAECVRIGPGACHIQLGAVQGAPDPYRPIAGTVETIDHAKRVVSIRTTAGEIETVDVPEGASGSTSSRSGTR